MYKVFVNDKLIKLIDDYSEYSSGTHTLFIRFYSKEALKHSVDLVMKKNSLEQLVVFHEDIKELWNSFKSLFGYMKAGGGVVRNKKNEFLFIFKRGKWDLPKGKVDGDEYIESTAIREVEEECGISDLKIVRELQNTHHIFMENNQMIVKHTSWYEMKTNYKGKLVVDEEEGIEKAEWLDSKGVKKAFQNSYPSIIDIFSSSFSN